MYQTSFIPEATINFAQSMQGDTDVYNIASFVVTPFCAAFPLF